ncbi:unnamed protein product [Peronospora effusa]|nr:unnamed protein product [Peronospora effusa]
MKRVRELVFDEMLSKYKFRPQTKTGKEGEKEGTNMEEDERGEHKVFEKVELALVQHCIFAIASANASIERKRSALYTLYKNFLTITRVDSFQAVQKEADKSKKKQKEENSAAIETVKKIAKDEKACAKNVQSKKRRIQMEAKVDAEAEIKKIEAKIATEAKVEKIEMMKMVELEKQEVKEMETKLVEKESFTSVEDKESAKEQAKVKKENFETKKETYVKVTNYEW